MKSCWSRLVRPKGGLAFTLMVLLSTVYYVFFLGAHYDVKHNHNLKIVRQQVSSCFTQVICIEINNTTYF